MENVSPVGYRLSPLQKSVWTDPELRFRIAQGSLMVEGPLDVGRLRDCFHQAASRHESLRTFFQVSRGFTLPFQVVSSAPSFNWSVQESQETDGSAEEGDSTGLRELYAERFAPPATEGDATFEVQISRVAADRHRLRVRVPALCADRESLAVLLAEVAGFYAGRIPAEEPVQYADFSEWHNEALQTVDERAEAYWTEPRPAQSLPLKGRAASVRPTTWASYPFELAAISDGETEESIVLLSCWQILLFRLTGQEPVNVSVMLSGRPLEDLAISVGRFAHPLPIVGEVNAQMTFGEAFAHTSAAWGDLNEFQSHAPAQEPGRIGFDYTGLPEAMIAGDLQVTFEAGEPVDSALHGGWSNLLTLCCRGGAGGVHCELRYDAGLYSVEEIARLAGYYTRTVEAARGDSSARVDSYVLMTDAERQEIDGFAHGPEVAYADARTFPELFEAQARLTPSLPAVCDKDHTLSYFEVNEAANRIASRLRKLGVGPGIAVGLCFQRSAEMLVALIGIAKAGGVYVPLLPDLPAARLAHQIGETGLNVLLTMQSELPVLADFAGTVLCLDRDGAELAGEPAVDVMQTVSPGDLMYILYTSGSTGTPKGVEVSHGNVTNYIHAITGRLNLRELSAEAGLTFATVSTLGADLGNTSLFPPLVSGGCVAVIDYDAALDGALYLSRSLTRPIDVLKITPSNLAALLASGAEVLPRRYLIAGGEAFSWELAARVRALGSCEIFNHYGPTEATIGCLMHALDRDDPNFDKPRSATVPLGKPLANVQVYLLDSQLRPVPTGAPGEIAVSGAGITRGYIARPKETEERFVVNPFLPAGSMLYRTGDLARSLPDGSIEFLGRIDHQVKIRGYRVELAEVEAVLRHAPGVESAVVMLHEEGTEGFLAAYVVSGPGGAEEQIRHHLRLHLPDYMIPRDVVFIERIPLSANGKVDRRQLAERSTGRQRSLRESLAPRTPLEEQLAGIWKEALKLETIGVRDDFFELGGHSLLATQIIARLRSVLGLSVSIRMLFEAPTIEQLAQAIESTLASDASSAGAEDSEMDELFAELEGLSDAEAEEVLASEEQKPRP